MNATKRAFKLFCSAAVAAAISCSSAFGLYAATITGNNVNFRSSAGGPVVSRLSNGTKVAVIDNNGDWYRIAVNGMTGFVSGEFIKGMPDCDFPLGNGTITSEGGVNMRVQPDTNSDVLTVVEDGATIAVVGVKNDWYKVEYGDQTGFIYTPYVSMNGHAPAATSRGQSADAEALRNEVTSYAAKFLGTPYVYGGSSPSGFDCSGFTSYVYKNTVRSIPRTATEQRNSLTSISMDELLPGDLVFFGSGDSISHTGIYVGNGQFIHSPHTGSSVKYDSLWTGNYNRRFVCGGRVIFD